TNVVTPVATVIVSIGLDHQAILGDTVQTIAFEKAGIVKRGVPVVLGEVPEAAAAVIEDVAQASAAPVWRFGRDVRWVPELRAVVTPAGTFEGLEPGLHGQWQA